jgi:hypothetical protein
MQVLTQILEATSASVDWTFRVADNCVLDRIALNFDAAPTTAEDATVKVNSVSGAAYSQVLSESDPATKTTLLFDLDKTLVIGDTVNVAYTNTDANEITGIAYFKIL